MITAPSIMAFRATPARGLARVARGLAAALIGVCMSSPAWASCGDYLQHALPPEDMPFAGRDIGSPSPGPPRPDSAPPCHGPNCRSLPPAPAPSPAPVRVETSRDQALTGEFLLYGDNPQTRQLPACSPTTQAGYPHVIERPPRPA
jgi:hypothetical protein